MFRKMLLAGLSVPAMIAVAHADTVPITVSSTAGTTYNAAALTGYQTFSADMVGSIVTVMFAGGGSSQATWTSAGAFGSGFSLTVAGDTFSSPWSLTRLVGATAGPAITGFTFNGVPGNTAFDIVSGSDGSPGSFLGAPIGSGTGPAGLNASAVYSNRLTVGGVFYGDLYTQLAVTFGGNGLTAGNTFTFVADTDNASASAGGITPSVPEPATWSMMMLGFGLVGGALRSRRTKVAFAA